MDTRTGAIAHFERADDAKRAGYTEKLSADEATALKSVSRKARVAELGRIRREKKRAQKAARRAQRGK